MKYRNVMALGSLTAAAVISWALLFKAPILESEPLTPPSGSRDTSLALQPVSDELASRLAASADLGNSGAPRSLRDQLKQYWGADYEANRKLLQGTEDELSAEVEIVDWSELHEELKPHFAVQEKERAALEANYLKWPDQIDAEFVASLDSSIPSSRIDESVVLAVSAIAEPINREIQRESTALVDVLDHAKKTMLENGDVERSLLIPIANGEAVTDRGDTLYSSSGRSGSWNYRYAIYANDFPEIPDKKRLLRALRDERKDSIREFLATLH